jgi:hypothetical protein
METGRVRVSTLTRTRVEGSVRWTPVITKAPMLVVSNISTDQQSGTVNFLAGGIAPNGGTSWFSLEEPPSAFPETPEPTTFVLLGTGLVFLRIRKLRKQTL